MFPVESSWQVPLSAVRAGGGYNQLENFWPVFALMDGPHTTYNNFLSAVDLDMIPLVDIGVDEITISNRNGNQDLSQETSWTFPIAGYPITELRSMMEVDSYRSVGWMVCRE